MIHKFDAKGAKCGIYGIYIDDKIVYIGQSSNLQNRAYQHEQAIRKGMSTSECWYHLAKEFYIRGHNFKFKVLEEVPQLDLFVKETEYISTLLPIFNTVIDKKRRKIPNTYEEAIVLINIMPRKIISKYQLECEERAASMGWFGEQYPNKEEFFWWEHH